MIQMSSTLSYSFLPNFFWVLLDFFGCFHNHKTYCDVFSMTYKLQTFFCFYWGIILRFYITSAESYRIEWLLTLLKKFKIFLNANLC